MVRPSQIPTIIELISIGAKEKPVQITTVELAARLGRSQQLASKHLEEMERDGLIERIRSNGRSYVKLTRAGIIEAAQIYRSLQKAFEETQTMVKLSGTVFSGLGEGAYYISLNGYKTQFKSKLGFEPFPGTLNLKLSSSIDRKIRRDLALSQGVHIEGFKDGKRTYGGAECFRAVLDGGVKGAVLILERTSHDDSIMEIISPVNVRQTLKLKEGDALEVTVHLPAHDKPLTQ